MSLNLKKAIVFHGFLGSSQDFESLNQDYRVFPIDLKPKLRLKSDLNTSADFETWAELQSRVFNEFETLIKSFDKNDEILIMSYSLGSKVLFSILDEVLNLISNLDLDEKIKFAFLSTHFGIYESDQELESELKFRTNMNQHFLELLDFKNKAEFMEQWNALGLFSKDEKIITDWTEGQIKHYFKSWNQSQTGSWIKVLNRLPKSFVFYGSADLKYKVQGQRLNEALDSKTSTSILIYELQSRSHRLLEAPDFDFVLKVIND